MAQRANSLDGDEGKSVNLFRSNVAEAKGGKRGRVLTYQYCIVPMDPRIAQSKA